MSGSDGLAPPTPTAKSPRKLTPSPTNRVLDIRHVNAHRNGIDHAMEEPDTTSPFPSFHTPAPPSPPHSPLDTYHLQPPPRNSHHTTHIPQHVTPTEHSPLLLRSSSSPSPLHSPLPSPAPRLLFWRPSSPSFRFFVLTLAMLIPFGPHLVKSSLSSLSSSFLRSPTFPLSHTQFGSFQSALSVPNLFIPFLGGLLLDLRGSPLGTCLFLLLTLIGHALFTLSCALSSYPSALLSRALFGLGQGSTVVAQGRIAAIYFKGHEMVFAIAVCESMHNLSALIARLYVVPMAEWGGTYVWSLGVGVAACALSTAAGVVYYVMDPHVWREEVRVKAQLADLKPDALIAEEALDTIDNTAASRSHTHPHTHPHPGLLPSSSSSSVSSDASQASVTSLILRPTALPITFILLCLLHLVHSNSYHLFDYISADFIQRHYHTSIMDSAVLSSITSLFAIVLCPIAGYALDHTGYKMYVVCACSLVTTSAFLLMAFTHLTPYVPLVLLSLSISFVPTVLRSAVPDCCPPQLLGTSYGAYEVMESFGAVIGHVGVGLIVDSTGGYFGALLAFAGLSTASCVLAVVMSVYDKAVGGTLNEKSGRSERRRRTREEKERRMELEVEVAEEEERRWLHTQTRPKLGDRSSRSIVY